LGRDARQKRAGRWLLLVPLLFAVIGLPLMLKIVPPNHFYGIRTAATLASDPVWYEANFWSGLVAVLLGIPATFLNFAMARSAALTDRQKHLFPLLVLLFVAAAMIGAGLLAS
jgi:hypothetical protein